MKKKYYTVFFASNRNQYSRSFQISKKEIIFLALFGILLIVLAVVGGLHITNWEPLTRELRSLRKDQMLLKNIIYDLDLSMNLDSSNAYENFISRFYSSHNMEFPDIPPVEGFVTRRLQLENNHLGIDIATKKQDDVRVPVAVRVVYSGISDDLGKTIIVSHPGGFVTVYGHNDTIIVNSGDVLQGNQIISRVGETGKSQGPHLHFEIWKNNQILDPQEIISKYKENDVSIKQTR